MNGRTVSHYCILEKLGEGAKSPLPRVILMIGKLISHYRIADKIGSGGCVCVPTDYSLT